MENPGKKQSGYKILNPELFSINGRGMQFHLEGFEMNDYIAISMIIEGYRGQCPVRVYPKDPDTIMFCPPDYTFPIGPGEYDYYSIQYIHDSIVACYMLPLNLYKLPISTQQNAMTFLNGEGMQKFENMRIN